MQSMVNDILHSLQELLQQKDFLLIGIDGRCAAGKTTLAALLQKACHCNVFHMDDFFLPFSLHYRQHSTSRAKNRRKEPGGNIDYERFTEEILLPLCRRESFSYRPFDCSRQTLKEPVAVEPLAVNIIEGSYSCHPILKDSYDLKIFLTIDPVHQMRRILYRNGEKQAAVFRDKWIPMEEHYFRVCRPQDHCDFIFPSPRSSSPHSS